MALYRIPEKVTYENYPDLLARVLREIRALPTVELDLDGVILDSPTKALIRRILSCGHCMVNLPETRANDIIYRRPDTELDTTEELFTERIGTAIYGLYDKVLFFFIIFVDMLYYAVQSLWDRRHIVKWDTIRNALHIGYKAIPIVMLLSFLIGLTLSIQAAIQMAKLGGQSYISTLIGIAMFTELGPLVTAIIIAGRTGSAIAAEIGTMVVMEEVDALKTMGVRPLKFMLVPKFWAFTLSMPILTLIACFAGIFGGLLVAGFYNVPYSAFINEIIHIMKLKDIVWGAIKSLTFAWVILAIACYQGLHVRGGADAVGRATTDSVVVSIFMVIVIDAVYSLILYT
jgi:phospholipid/cholesterol/gamma-HCH transport system permease protein